jgi:DNA-binding transcriptional MocR family regulator
LLLEHALAGGIAFVAGHAFYPDPAGESELRLCFSSVVPPVIDDAIRRLAAGLVETTRVLANDVRRLVSIA